MLLREHVKLDLLFTDKVCGHMAYGHVGGADYGQARGRTIVGSGESPKAAAQALVTANAPHLRPKGVRSAAWALEQALSLAVDAVRGGPEHTWHECHKDCMVCDGGLQLCEVCGQAEGDLERGCPGRG